LPEKAATPAPEALKKVLNISSVMLQGKDSLKKKNEKLNTMPKS
jgi:hypothetical protein